MISRKIQLTKKSIRCISQSKRSSKHHWGFKQPLYPPNSFLLNLIFTFIFILLTHAKYWQRKWSQNVLNSGIDSFILLALGCFPSANVNIGVFFCFNQPIPTVCTGKNGVARAFFFLCLTLWKNRPGQCKNDCMVLLGKRPQVLWNRIWNSWTTAVFYFKIDNICNAYGPRHVWRHRQTIWMVSKDTCT